MQLFVVFAAWREYMGTITEGDCEGERERGIHRQTDSDSKSLRVELQLDG